MFIPKNIFMENIGNDAVKNLNKHYRKIFKKTLTLKKNILDFNYWVNNEKNSSNLPLENV